MKQWRRRQPLPISHRRRWSTSDQILLLAPLPIGTSQNPCLRNIVYVVRRYVLLVYNQNTLPTADTTFGAAAAPFVNASTSRANFNVTQFSEQTMITGPVAGTFFYVAPDSPAPSSSSLPATGTAASDSTATSTSNSATQSGSGSHCLAALVALILLAFCSV